MYTVDLTLKFLKQRLGAFRYYFFLFACMAGCGYLGYLLKDMQVTMQDNKVAMLEHSVANLKLENEELTKRLNILGIELEVARLANVESEKSIQQGIDEQQALRRELSFYQKVMAPELEQEGFVIDALDILPTNSGGYFRYALTLLQYDKRRERIKGSLQVTLIGSENDKPARYKLTELLSNDSDSLPFSFRYFEILKGEFWLPEGFMPEQVLIESVLSEAKWGKRHLDRSFEWQPVAEDINLADK